MRPIVVTHCGVGSIAEVQDVAGRSGRAGMQQLRRGGSALDAAIAAVVVLEDDPRTNAGTGSRMRLDGSIQMDAAVMDSRRRVGAVAAISNVKNPILVARKVMDTPHLLLTGEWATRFARRHGFPFYDPATDRARERWHNTLTELAKKKLPAWAKAWRTYSGSDTVGAVARDGKGRFVAANSTGGVSYMLPGRVGDSPIVGAGLYAGPMGAVAATGVGEEIVRLVLCKFVYDQIEDLGVRGACDAGLKLFPKSVPIGLIAVAKDGAAEADNREMAWWTTAAHVRKRRV
ncbi:MAG: isoaspartyl peptidase/L-asparaginase [Euryarchaeota archaeon]|nr:isoaspartyl peptidase/L-asparaginase [Euryarchaeota archaeon]